MTPTPTDHDLLIKLNENMSHVKADIAKIYARLDDKYVTKDEFAPIQKLVYLLVGIVLSAVGGGVMTIILK